MNSLYFLPLTILNFKNAVLLLDFCALGRGIFVPGETLLEGVWFGDGWFKADNFSVTVLGIVYTLFKHKNA